MRLKRSFSPLLSAVIRLNFNEMMSLCRSILCSCRCSRNVSYPTSVRVNGLEQLMSGGLSCSRPRVNS